MTATLLPIERAYAAAAVRLWLLVVAVLVLAMVVVGGATRLTGSGLSITRMAADHGRDPTAVGRRLAGAFAKYQQIPSTDRQPRHEPRGVQGRSSGGSGATVFSAV